MNYHQQLRFVLLVLISFGVNIAFAKNCANTSKKQVADVILSNSEMIDYLGVEIPNCDYIQVQNDFVEFSLDKSNHKIHNGVRSEVSLNYPFAEGDKVEYSWKFNVPSINTPGADKKAWWLIGQWHDQPDKRIGETWATFKGQPPPVAIYIEKRNGIAGIGISAIGPDGRGGKKYQWVALPLDEWLEIRVTIYWRYDVSGVVKIDFRNHPEMSLEYNGRNMNNSYHHYLKVGQYRAPWVRQKSRLFVKDISIKHVK